METVKTYFAYGKGLGCSGGPDIVSYGPYIYKAMAELKMKALERDEEDYHKYEVQSKDAEQLPDGRLIIGDKVYEGPVKGEIAMLDKDTWKLAITALGAAQVQEKKARKTGSRPSNEVFAKSCAAAERVRLRKVEITAHINAYHTIRGNEELCHSVPEDNWYYQSSYKNAFDMAMETMAAKVEQNI